MAPTPLPPLPTLAPGPWLHAKGGRYTVVGVARHSETLEPMVLYRSEHDGGLWARPLAMWAEPVPDPAGGGGTVPRFRLAP